MSGVRIKVGRSPIASKLFAKRPFTRPMKENMSVVSIIAAAIMLTCKKGRSTKNHVVAMIIRAIRVPRITPPDANQSVTAQAGTGATRTSSIFLWNFDIKTTDATFEKAFVITQSITSPGMINTG